MLDLILRATNFYLQI